MKQLGGLDELFLALERNNQCMHVAALGIYDPSTAPGGHVRLRDILAHLRRRLDVAPLFRRRLAGVPFNVDRPYWVDEATADLEYHVHHIALPDPGDWRQLCIQVARLHSQPLDRSRPLWQAYVIEGLNRVEGVPEGSFAIYVKFHHAAVDGDTSIQIMRALHSMIAVPEHHGLLAPPVADAPPSALELCARAVGNLAPRGVRAWFTGVTLGTKLTSVVMESLFRRLTGRETSLLDSLRRQFGWPEAADASRFDGAVSSRRMVEGLRLPVRTLQRIRDSMPGTTFDDVFLAVVGGALRDYLTDCGDALPAGFAAGIPATGQDVLPGGSGNHTGLRRLLLHPEIASPAARLAAICHARAESLQTTDVLGPGLVRDLADQVPTGISSFVVGHLLTGYASALVATVRGPDHPMYLAGARLQAFYPVGFVMDGIGLSVNGFRYGDDLWVTIVSCRKMLSEPQRFARALEANLAVLAAAVEPAEDRARKGAASRPAPRKRGTAKRPPGARAAERARDPATQDNDKHRRHA